MSSIVKTTIIVLIIAGVGYFGYSYLTRSGVPSGDLLQQTSSNTSQMGAEVLAALNQLKILKLDSSIFQDKVYLSLQDFSKPLNPEPVGRINPFNPIGVETGGSIKLPTTVKTTGTTTGTTTNRVGAGN